MLEGPLQRASKAIAFGIVYKVHFIFSIFGEQNIPMNINEHIFI